MNNIHIVISRKAQNRNFKGFITKMSNGYKITKNGVINLHVHFTQLSTINPFKIITSLKNNQILIILFPKSTIIS